jgi:hypothetical protein
MHMKISALAGAILALTLGAGVANAADLPAGGLKDGTPSSLSGFYGEIAVGYGFSQGTVTGLAASGADLAATGALFNIRAGYDKLLAGRIGAGLWAEGSNGFDVNGNDGGFTLGQHWSYGGGAKGFYDYGSGQFYALAGYEQTIVSLPGGNRTLDGLLWGIGVSTKLTSHSYVKMEFDQIYNGKINWTAPFGDAAAQRFGLSEVDNRVLIGVGFSTN